MCGVWLLVKEQVMCPGNVGALSVCCERTEEGSCGLSSLQAGWLTGGQQGGGVTPGGCCNPWLTLGTMGSPLGLGGGFLAA